MEPCSAAAGGFYAVLGLGRGASGEEVTQAYRRLALQRHPDKTKDSADAAAAAFRQIQEAYETLRDPLQRTVYDEALQRGVIEASAASPLPLRPPPGDLVPAWPAQEPERGGLAVGSCLLTAAASLLCGLPAALGVASCSAGGVVLRAADGAAGAAARRWAAAALMGLGLLLLCGSPAAWTLGFYLATALGLAALASERDRLPDFLPYVLFAGYLLLYLLAPVYDASPSSVRLDVVRVGGFVWLEERVVEEAASPEDTLPKCAAVFTWGIVAVRWLTSLRERRPFDAEKPQCV